MIYSLSSLSDLNYKLYKQIVQRVEDGEDKKSKKASTGLTMTKVDCKGSNFRGIRGLSDNEVTDVLTKCANGDFPLNKLNSHCFAMKKMKKIRDIFVSRVGVKDWTEAKEKYSQFTNEDTMSTLFIKLNFNPVPAVFNEYCARALT